MNQANFAVRDLFHFLQLRPLDSTAICTSYHTSLSYCCKRCKKIDGYGQLDELGSMELDFNIHDGTGIHEGHLAEDGRMVTMEKGKEHTNTDCLAY